METVQKKRQSLPRHTLIAPIGRRMGAAIVDAAFAFLLTLILYFGAFRLIFNSTITNLYSDLIKEELNSHLFYYREEDQSRQSYKDGVEYQTFLDVLSYYYMNYLTGENVEIPEGYEGNPDYYKAPNYQEYVPGTEKLPKDYYDVQWFNSYVLEIVDDIPNEETTSYFQYVIVDGKPDKTQIGIRRTEHYSTTYQRVVQVPETETSNVLFLKYEDAYFGSLLKMDFYSSINNELTMYYSISFMIPLIIASLIYYVFIPVFTSNSATFGKKIFKLGLCGIDGYSMQKWHLLLRIVPLILTILGMFLLPSPNYYFSFAFGIIVLMVSIALYAASPKHCSLHDYAGRTLVIDAECSIIFDNEIEEDEYIKAEDLQ